LKKLLKKNYKPYINPEIKLQSKELKKYLKNFQNIQKREQENQNN